MSAGFIYVLSNPDFPGLVKVGFSTKVPEIRAQEIGSHEGIPSAMVVEYYAFVDSEVRRREKDVHVALSDFHHGKEWFQCTKSRALSAVRKECQSELRFEWTNPALLPHLESQKSAKPDNDSFPIGYAVTRQDAAFSQAFKIYRQLLEESLSIISSKASTAPGVEPTRPFWSRFPGSTPSTALPNFTPNESLVLSKLMVVSEALAPYNRFPKIADRTLNFGFASFSAETSELMFSSEAKHAIASNLTRRQLKLLKEFKARGVFRP